MKIDIPKILLKLRSEIVATPSGHGGMERTVFRLWAWLMCHPRLFALTGSLAARFSPRPANGAWLRKLPGFLSPPPLRKWLSQRDLPPPAARSFRSQWRQRQKSK